MELVYLWEIIVNLYLKNVILKLQLDVKIKDVMLQDLSVNQYKVVHKNYKDVKMVHVYQIFKVVH